MKTKLTKLMIGLLVLTIAIGLIVSVNAHLENKNFRNNGFVGHHHVMHGFDENHNNKNFGCQMMNGDFEIDEDELDEMYNHHIQMHGFIDREEWNKFHNIDG